MERHAGPRGALTRRYDSCFLKSSKRSISVKYFRPHCSHLTDQHREPFEIAIFNFQGTNGEAAPHVARDAVVKTCAGDPSLPR